MIDIALRRLRGLWVGRFDLIEEFKIFISNFIEIEETEEEVLDSFRSVIKDIASGEAIKNAIPLEDLFKEVDRKLL